jgi:hypothetical protein
VITMKKLLPLIAVLGAALLVVYKTKSSKSSDDLWKQATAG